MGFVESGADATQLPPISPTEAKAVIEQYRLREHKTEMLELFLHQSQVLDVIPDQHREQLTPIVHDALLAFLDGLSEERLIERLMPMLRLRKDAPRGERVLILASKIPTLQKTGQIIARFEGIPADIRQALERLENEISTMSRDELVAYITHDLGSEAMERHQIRLADEILAEASVGAVIRGSFLPPGGASRREIVAKVVKPYAQTGLPEELDIISGLIDISEKHAAFYHLEGFSIREFFQNIRAHLEDEIQVLQEQENFHRAYEYYRGHKSVTVPKVYDFSTQHVTFMDFLRVRKITEAYPGDPKRRAILARKLARVMSYEALFSKHDVAVFHGDPHAGNVMHLYDDSANPYKIALLDWGLMGRFPREQRVQLVQLSLALRHKNRKRLLRNVGALLDSGLPEDPDRRQQVATLLDETLAAGLDGTFATFGALIEKLVENGYALDANMSLFIKSQLTLAGIFRELDPTLDQDKFLAARTRAQVARELPKRLLLLPAWRHRGYRSLLTTGDVLSAFVH
ncbi:MAG: AarF/ABC1/UbiB kinase family protein [bacterium]|nr:AarF/ABC1/UbiB kinase family protein [bacterium]